MTKTEGLNFIEVISDGPARLPLGRLHNHDGRFLMDAARVNAQNVAPGSFDNPFETPPTVLTVQLPIVILELSRHGLDELDAISPVPEDRYPYYAKKVFNAAMDITTWTWPVAVVSEENYELLFDFPDFEPADDAVPMGLTSELLDKLRDTLKSTIGDLEDPLMPLKMSSPILMEDEGKPIKISWFTGIGLMSPSRMVANFDLTA